MAVEDVNALRATAGTASSMAGVAVPRFRWRGRGTITAVLLLVAIGTFVYHASIYWAWTEDDAFISFRYAQNLVHGHGLVFNPGERIEGYSNFNWVLLAAAALRAGLDPVAVSKWVGLAAGVLCVLLSWLLARRLVPGPGLAALLAPFYLALSPVLVRHSISGLETGLFALLLMAAVLLASRRRGVAWSAALVPVLVLLMCTRPEGPAMAAIILAVRALLPAENEAEGRIVSRRSVLVEAPACAALFGVYFVWRWRYFGEPFPNTFYAKAGGGLAGIADGAQYTLNFLYDAGGVLFIGLGLVPLVLGRMRPAYVLSLAALLMASAFVMAAGGDWMFHYRFYAHVLPILAAMIAAGINALFGLSKPAILRTAPLYGVMALVLLTTLMGLGNIELRIARMVLPALRQHNYLSQNYEELGLWFRDNSPPEASIAISDVGAVGYFSERRIIDMFGLIDAHIGRLPGRIHYKADARYVLSLAPDFIVLVSVNDEGVGRFFQRIPDCAMNAQPEFLDRYELIRTVPQYWQNEFVLVFRRRG